MILKTRPPGAEHFLRNLWVSLNSYVIIWHKKTESDCIIWCRFFKLRNAVHNSGQGLIFFIQFLDHHDFKKVSREFNFKGFSRLILIRISIVLQLQGLCDGSEMWVACPVLSFFVLFLCGSTNQRQNFLACTLLQKNVSGVPSCSWLVPPVRQKFAKINTIRIHVLLKIFWNYLNFEGFLFDVWKCFSGKVVLLKNSWALWWSENYMQKN